MWLIHSYLFYNSEVEMASIFSRLYCFILFFSCLSTALELCKKTCKIPVCVSLVCTCVDLRWNYTLNKYTLKFCLWRDVFCWGKVLSFRERSGKSAWRPGNAHGANIYTKLTTLRCCWRQERTLHFILSSSLGSHYTMGAMKLQLGITSGAVLCCASV